MSSMRAVSSSVRSMASVISVVGIVMSRMVGILVSRMVGVVSRMIGIMVPMVTVMRSHFNHVVTIFVGRRGFSRVGNSLSFLRFLVMEGLDEIQIHLEFELFDQQKIEGIADNGNAEAPRDVAEGSFNIVGSRGCEGNHGHSNEKGGKGKGEFVVGTH